MVVGSCDGNRKGFVRSMTSLVFPSKSRDGNRAGGAWVVSESKGILNL